MDLAKDFFWNDSLNNINFLYGDNLPYPLTSYFYIQQNTLVFDEKKELNYDVKKIIQLTFDAIFVETGAKQQLKK